MRGISTVPLLISTATGLRSLPLVCQPEPLCFQRDGTTPAKRICDNRQSPILRGSQNSARTLSNDCIVCGILPPHQFGYKGKQPLALRILLLFGRQGTDRVGMMDHLQLKRIKPPGKLRADAGPTIYGTMLATLLVLSACASGILR